MSLKLKGGLKYCLRGVLENRFLFRMKVRVKYTVYEDVRRGVGSRRCQSNTQRQYLTCPLYSEYTTSLWSRGRGQIQT